MSFETKYGYKFSHNNYTMELLSIVHNQGHIRYFSKALVKKLYYKLQYEQLWHVMLFHNIKNILSTRYRFDANGGISQGGPVVTRLPETSLKNTLL